MGGGGGEQPGREFQDMHARTPNSTHTYVYVRTYYCSVSIYSDVFFHHRSSSRKGYFKSHSEIKNNATQMISHCDVRTTEYKSAKT